MERTILERKKPLTNEEIRRLSWMSGNISYISPYLDNIKIEKEILPFLEYLKNCSVVEIGPGGNPINKKWGCGEYVGVQPFKCHVPDIDAEKYVICDGLTYLRECKEKSSVIICVGVLDEDVLVYEGNFLGKRYIQEFSEQIKRVSHPFALVVGNDVKKYMGDPNFGKVSWTQGGIYVFDPLFLKL